MLRRKPKLILGNWTADVCEGFYAPPRSEGQHRLVYSLHVKIGTREVSSAEFEGEVVMLVHSYLCHSESLKSLLDKYQASSPDEIEKKISEGKLPEHPTYEDYLDALASLDSMRFFLEHLRRMLGILEAEIPQQAPPMAVNSKKS